MIPAKRRTTQSIPDEVLDKIVAHQPGLATLVCTIRDGTWAMQSAETTLANNYLNGVPRLTAPEIWALTQCCRGGAYGATHT